MTDQPALFRNKFQTILVTGLLAGTLDITAASVQYYLKTGNGPAAVLRFVASGVYGKEAFTGGTNMAAMGLLFHFIIAILFTIVYFNSYPLVKSWLKNPWVIALCFGLLTWTIMNRVVLPLSQAPPIPFHLDKALVAAGILVVCIGLPVALMANKYYLYKKS